MKHTIAIMAVLLGMFAQAYTYTPTYPKPTEPTYNQMERLIKAASNDTTPVSTNRVLYTKPTYNQMERLISAVKSGGGSGSASGAGLMAWDCVAGLPTNSMSATTYKVGDAYLVVNTAKLDTSDCVYKHTIVLDAVSMFSASAIATDVTFSFTNSASSAYTTYDDVIEAASAVYTGRKSFSATGTLTGGALSQIYYVDPSVDAITGDHILMLANEEGLSHSDGQITNATRLVDTVVAVASDGSPLVADPNYRPSGASYVSGVASTVVETNRVYAGDMYWYDGDDWTLLPTSAEGISAVVTNDIDTSMSYVGTLWSTGQVWTSEFGDPDTATTVAMTNVEVRWTGTEYQMHVVGTMIGTVSAGDGTSTMYAKAVDAWIPTATDTNTVDDVDGNPFGDRNTDLNSTALGPMKGSLDYFGIDDCAQLISTKIGTKVYTIPGTTYNALGLAYRTELDDVAVDMTNYVDETFAKTGIHLGETTLKTQYVAGVYGAVMTCENDRSLEIGYNAKVTEYASSSQAIAIGRDALSAGSATVAVGPNSFAYKDQAIAMGWRANAVGPHSIAIGGAKQSGQDYFTTNGTVNTESDLNLAEGAYSIAIGYNTKATNTDSVAIGDYAKANGTGAFQLGRGTNDVAHTLKFEDVVIVKNGQVVGATSEPETVAPTMDGDETTVNIKPGAMVTALPTVAMTPGSELALVCTGLRNYTFYLPNTPETREGLPVNVMFETSAGRSQVMLGTNVVSHLPIRFKSEQPYGGLSVMEVTAMNDGYDWSPVITNVNLAFSITQNKFVSTNTTASIQGRSLQCGTTYKMTYPLASGGTKTVDLMSIAAGKSYMDTTFYGFAGAVEYAVTTDTAPPVTDDTMNATITYGNEYGTFTTNVVISIE